MRRNLHGNLQTSIKIATYKSNPNTDHVLERSTDGKCNTSAGSIPERVNTSDGGPNDWLYVDRVPAFGDPPTAEDYERLLAGFDVVYTLRCTRPAPDGTPDIVNILHVSPVEQYGYDRFVCESEIVEIEKFMVSRGFKIEKIDGPSGWGSADVLILGTDKNHMHDRFSDKYGRRVNCQKIDV